MLKFLLYSSLSFFRDALFIMLYNYRYKNRKDYFKCSFNKVIKAFDKCIESIKCVESQVGGKVTYYENKIKKMYNTISLSNIL